MAEKVCVAGAAMTKFGRTPGKGVGMMAMEAVGTALQQAGVMAFDVSRVYFGNAAAGRVSGQEMIRGQVAFRGTELADRPVYNVENACASGGTAFQLAFEAIRGGACDLALVVGAEQMTHEDKQRTFDALRGSTDIADIGEGEGDAASSILMEFYAAEAQSYLDRYGADASDFARVAVKNRHHAERNRFAQYRQPQSVEEVLAGRSIVPPLTLPMCSPVTDGAAALVVCSEEKAEELGADYVEVLASALGAQAETGTSPVIAATGTAYEMAGVGPDDLDVLELHDAAAPAELFQYAEVGLCDEGEGHHLLRRGDTTLGGRIPVNTSGGLLSRGHALGATGCAQLVEIVDQLRGRGEGRQVDGATVGMAVNGGGWLDGTYAVTVASILKRAG